MKPELHIIKIGGGIVEDADKLAEALTAFARIPGKKILVHGGGRRASILESQLGLETQMVDGRRITSASSLEIVVMVYAGLLNTQMVAQLQALGENAIGLSGADMNIIHAEKRQHPEIDFGYVGDILKVNAQALTQLLDAGQVPVLCAISHDGQGQLLNTNADTIASRVAQALCGQFAVRLRYVFEFPGILKDIAHPTDTFAQLNRTDVATYKADGTLSAGMLPKIDNALAAKAQGVDSVSICAIDNLLSQHLATEIR